MSDLASILIVASSSVAALAITSAAALKGWKAWLEVKRLEIASPQHHRRHAQGSAPGEIVDMRERVRALEAIANGGCL